ncbi:MAG: hypothetical protein M3297_15085 [Thermoproteota archaeon]|nr:hypothetical protein [Thermoproteota archaeon]
MTFIGEILLHEIARRSVLSTLANNGSHKIALEGSYYSWGHRRLLSVKLFFSGRDFDALVVDIFLGQKPHNTISKGKFRLKASLSEPVLN